MEKMKIIVIIAKRPSITLDIDPDESVENVKAMLESETSVARQQQQLLYNGTEMKNHEKLSGLGVGDGDVIAMAADAASSASDCDLGFNFDGSAANPSALLQQMQHDPIPMAQLIQALVYAAPSGVEVQKNREAASCQKGIDESLATTLDYNSGAIARVVMLYGDMEVNGVPIRAIVDTGSQSTIISKSCAERCGLLTLMDQQYKGLSHEVDQSDILGMICVAPVKIGSVLYSCSFMVLDSPNAEVLFGLDMLREHQCIIDLKDNVLNVGGGEVSVPFLAEKDLLSHILDEERNSKQASSPVTPLVTSGANGSNTIPNGSQSAGESAQGGFPQVPLGSPASRSPPANTKGYGLKKWRRKRRELVKDTTPNTDFTKGLKRNYTNNNSVAEMNRKSEGSVFSTSVFVKNPISGGDSFPIIEPDTPACKLAGIATFSLGTDSDNSEDRSSMSSTAASAPKSRHDLTKLSGHPREKHRAKHFSPKHSVGNTDPPHQRAQVGMMGQAYSSKKPRGEAIIVKKSLSSLESDCRSSNTVFMQWATSASVNGQSERAMAYNGGGHGENHLTEGLRIGLSKNNVREGEELSQQDDAELSLGVGRSKNREILKSRDLLVNCVYMLESAQEALEREIQKFGELGKRLHSWGSCDSIMTRAVPSEYVGRFVLNVPMKAKLIELTQNVESLEKQVEEAKAKLLEKESRIVELKGAMLHQRKFKEVEAELESLLRQKLEAEIEYFAIKDSVTVAQNQKKLLAEQERLGRTHAKMSSTIGNYESKAKALKEENSGSKVKKIQNRVAKFSLCFFVQFILLASVLHLFLVQLWPKASVVIPT